MRINAIVSELLRTLAQVAIDLNGVLVYGNGLSSYKGTLVSLCVCRVEGLSLRHGCRVERE